MVYAHVVSVGGDCQPAHQIRRITGNEGAHFFDWLQLGSASVARLIDQDFACFLVDASDLTLERLPHEHIRDARYGAELLHDFPLTDEFLHQLDAVRKKYEFLARRWRELMALDATILFVWHGNEGCDAIARLASALRSRRAYRPFHLLALRSDVQEPDWQLRDVSNRFLRRLDPYVWTGDDAAWDAHFGRAARTKS